MFRTRVLVAWLLVVVATWGCARTAPSASSASAPRVAALEAELKQARAAGKAEADGLRAKLSDAERKLTAEVARGQAVERERDAARADAKTRAAERDAVTVQYDGFRKSLREMLGQAEAAAPPAPRAVAAEELPMPRGGF